MDYSLLDQNIRNVVKFLNENNFNTTDSGDGVSKNRAEIEHVLPYPHVFMTCKPTDLWSESCRLLSLLKENGINVQPIGPEGCTHPSIQSNLDPTSEIAFITLNHVDDEVLRIGLESFTNNCE